LERGADETRGEWGAGLRFAAIARWSAGGFGLGAGSHPQNIYIIPCGFSNHLTPYLTPAVESTACPLSNCVGEGAGCGGRLLAALALALSYQARGG